MPGSDRGRGRLAGNQSAPERRRKVSIFPTRILLATDGSEEADLASRTALDLAGKMNSELHVVHIHHPRQVPYAYDERYTELEQEPAGGEAKALLERQVRKIEQAGGTVAGAHVREGNPEEIVAFGEEMGADLIIMGNRGHTSP